ncbi:MAG: hypothetical protein C4526_06015 [Nitrospiraceae bacterium]|nr:MAG: hypothetical protein C4526_06015 [Nitrospiraceae bacterium]
MKRKIKKYFNSGVAGAVLLFLISSLLIGGCSKSHSNRTEKKVIVLGFDGMDPDILERLIREGKMPHFENLMQKGNYRELETSIPPQSPVAWSNFITGMNPGGHGIYDFIHRDPETMIPFLSTSEVRPADKKITLGGWTIPVSKDKLVLLRKGTAFWEMLDKHNIPATVIRVPANFPIMETETRSLSGMGTPDIQGTYGIFSFYTTEDSVFEKDVSGGKIFPVRMINNRVEASIEGPRNTFKKGAPRSKVDFQVVSDPEHSVAKILLQDRQVILKQGEWSPWVRMEFELIPFFQKVSGICRFYLKEIYPVFKLYVTPVNIDPSDPAMPVSTPEHFVKELYEEVGPFYTQGIPEDTKALIQGVLNDDEFLVQARISYDEFRRIFMQEMGRFNSGLLFFYFGSTDQLSHVFWRTMDPAHPAYDPSGKNADVIEKTYMEMDGILGFTMDRLDGKTTLIVLSDHGFAPYYRSFNINTWLRDEGYIALRDGAPKGEFFENVDWSGTRAYGLGFNGLYLNMKGREKNGIVLEGGERETLINELSAKLLSIRDPKTGQNIITKVYRTDEVYTGPHLKNAPELIVGYNRGYRASWETVLGNFPEGLFSDNNEKWSGDHLMAAELVPGILLANRRIRAERPSLLDIAPTILKEFGITKNKEMVGSSIF